MSRNRGPKAAPPTSVGQRLAGAGRLIGPGSGSRGRILLALLVIAGLIAPGASGPARAQPQRAVAFSPQLQLNPTSGLPGSNVSLSGGGYPRVSDLAPAAISFDGVSVGSTAITGCSVPGGLPSFGFGTLCTGTAVTLVVPQNATTGPHTITVTGVDANGSPAYPASATFTVSPPAAPPAMILDPTSGQAGATTSVSVINLPGTAAQQPAAITFDGAALGSVPTQPCTVGSAAGTFGFGAACTGNALFEQIPQAASPGPHTITATTPAPNNPGGPISVSAVYTVLAPQVTDTATATATVTDTPVPATGTVTNTPPPAATATNTATATVTSTPTNTPIPRPHLILIKPDFNNDNLLIALTADPASPVHLSLRVVTVHNGTTTTRYSLNVTGAGNGAGLFGMVVHLKFHQHLRGRADLRVAITRGGQAVTANRSFAYSLSS